MATQIASTPVLKNIEAVKVYQEAHKTPSKKVESGFKVLEEMFKNRIK